MINTKDKIIEYFNSGIKDTKKLKIGIEHEKFLFNNLNNKRIDYKKIKEMFSALLEFGWNPILEKENIVGLNKGGKNITLEPGNQIELSGDKLNHIHEACAESYDYLFELKRRHGGVAHGHTVGAHDGRKSRCRASSLAAGPSYPSWKC